MTQNDVEQAGGDSPLVNRLQRLVQQRADERGWSVAHVATRAGLNRQTLYNLMKADEFKAMPSNKTLIGLAKALEMPDRMVRDAAAESIGIRVYDEPVDDPDMKVVIATMERLSKADRRRLREMAEVMFRDVFDGER